MNVPGTLAASILAVGAAFLDALTLFNVFPVTPEQKTAILTVLTSLLSLAGLMIPLFQHNHGVTTMLHRSPDPTRR